MSFLNELKRRNVLRIGAAYIVGSWLLIQVAETIFPLFGFDDTPARLVVIVLTIGFIPSLIFSWVFEITPEGLKKEADVDHSGSDARVATRKLDRAILVVLALALGYFAFDKFVLDPVRDQSKVETARQEGRSEALVESYGDKSIAVLPFVDMSADKNQEYMSDGIAEELLNLLAKIPELRVISRSSAFAFKDKDIDIPTVAEQLNVAYVLEGSVRTAGQQTRITAQLIEARSDTHLWSQTYDRKLEDIFQIQDEISASIIASLRVTLLDGEGPFMAQGRSTDAGAYNAYLIGKERMALRTQKDLEAARAQFEKAIEIDPQFAAAHVQLAHTWLLLEQLIYGGQASGFEERDAIIAAQLDKALALTPDLPEAHGVQGFHHLQRNRYAEARKALDRAISLNPNYALAYNWRADTAHEQERFLDMLADREKAYSLDPMSLQISSDLAGEYRNFWRPKDAERVINRMFDLHPDHPLAYRAAAYNLGMHGRHAEAQLMTEKAIAANPDNRFFKRTQPIGLYFMGLFEEVEALDSDVFKFSVYLNQGRYKEAKAMLEKHQQENPGSWRRSARRYYRRAEEEQGMKMLAEIVEQTISSANSRKYPWREKCNIYLIYDLRLTGDREDAVESMMAGCDTVYERRLKAGFFCPCDMQELVLYSILDNRIDEAVERAERWLASGWSTIDMAINPIFKLLSDRPEYQGLLDSNAAQVERQKRMYLAGRNSLVTEGGIYAPPGHESLPKDECCSTND